MRYSEKKSQVKTSQFLWCQMATNAISWRCTGGAGPEPNSLIYRDPTFLHEQVREKKIWVYLASDLGWIQEENWYESEIQAALLDEFILHLEKSSSMSQLYLSIHHLIFGYSIYAGVKCSLTMVYIYLVYRLWPSTADPSMSALYFGLMAMIIRAEGC